jgi:cytochrome c oxidase subunit III
MSTMLSSKQYSVSDPSEPTPVVPPLKFITWIFIVSICMMFGALTSAYIVRRAEGNWLEFELPSLFLTTSILIIVSSITLQVAYMAAKKDNLTLLKVLLGVTTALGFGFLIGQYEAWGQLVRDNVFFGGTTSNPSGSFVYVLTGLHAFHLITGLIFLIIVLISALNYRVHSRNLLRLELCTTYWHFLGALWLFLYGFLLLNN